MVNFVAMMIEKHISALLYRYQCVTVPGLGAFLTEICSAHLDAGTHTFYPPKKLISFNANVKNNDGLLANHIALQEKISYTEAVASINIAVSQWKQALSDNDVITLKNLGEMALNSEGSIVFTPNTPVNYLTEAFGLSAVASPAVKREVYKAQAEALEEKAPVIFTPERKRNYSYLKYAAVFALLMGAGLTGFKAYNDNRVATQTLAVQNAVQQKVEQQIQQATFFIDNPIPAVTLPLKEVVAKKMPYHVVAGAYKSEANADKAMNSLKAKGFKARRLKANKFGLYPVLYGSFARYNEAKQTMREIHITGDKEAWILVQDL
jgi:hypothetical protein